MTFARSNLIKLMEPFRNRIDAKLDYIPRYREHSALPLKSKLVGAFFRDTACL